ncbi:GL19718 [Drosophila persimilis]|uniref:Barrier-to-autointegration factor-like protein n=1 Tax=Drosophila persimilis TaxID=7234 RepID=B4HB40_DROPE|nr:barrier-to-autointegration factor [Drosophila persimilis]EDW37843.1 GL19718 [Drosophila persimilis]
MSRISKKCSIFLAEPMGEKSVTELSGIGPTLGERLTEAGFDKAYHVLGQFLILKKDEVLFIHWMRELCSASSKQASDCYDCLNDWCEEFL